MWLSLQELEELLAHLGHDGAHVVPSDGVTVVQVHHSLFQVTGGRKGWDTGGLQQMEAPPGGNEAQGAADKGEGGLKPEMGGGKRGWVEKIRKQSQAGVCFELFLTFTQAAS